MQKPLGLTEGLALQPGGAQHPTVAIQVVMLSPLHLIRPALIVRQSCGGKGRDTGQGIFHSTQLGWYVCVSSDFLVKKKKKKTKCDNVLHSPLADKFISKGCVYLLWVRVGVHLCVHKGSCVLPDCGKHPAFQRLCI